MTIQIYAKPLRIIVVKIYAPMTDAMELEIEDSYASIKNNRLVEVSKNDITVFTYRVVSMQKLAVKQQQALLAALDLDRGMMQVIIWFNFVMRIIFIL